MIDVDRSIVAPASLARKTSYAERDVLEALHRDFFGKCYLCERKLAIGEIEVDHRRPVSEWPEGTYDWPNLFPACAFCNKRRVGSPPKVGLLSPGEGIEHRIAQLVHIDHRGTAIVCEFAPCDPDDAPALATAQELDRIHSGQGARSPRTRFATRGLLDMIHDRFLEDIHPLQLKVRRGRERQQRDLLAEVALANVVSRHAPFTMLMRSLIHRTLWDLFD